MLIKFSIPIEFPYHGGHTFRHLYFESDRCPSREDVLKALVGRDRDCIKYIELAEFPRVDASVRESVGYCKFGNSRMPITATVIEPYRL